MRLSLLDPDSRFGKVCGMLANLIIVNLCFVLTLVPVITAGAGICAMYYAMMKLVRSKDIRPAKDFLKGFRENFKRATLVWLILSGLAAALFFDFRIAAFMGPWAHGLWIGLAGVALVLLLISMYLFPVMACFYGSLREQIRNSVLFAGRNIFLALAVFAINTLPMFFTYWFAGYLPLFAFLWCMFGFALTAYLNSHLLLHLFIPYLGPAETVEDYGSEDEMMRKTLEEMKMLE